MKATVVEVFIDKYTGVQYNVGEQVDFDEERINDLTSRKLVKVETPKKRRTTKK